MIDEVAVERAVWNVRWGNRVTVDLNDEERTETLRLARLIPHESRCGADKMAHLLGVVQRQPIYDSNRTECIHGHKLTSENTYTRKGRPSPSCLTCKNLSRRSKRARPPVEARTHCVHGHELAPGNTYARKGRRTPQCRICLGKRDRVRVSRRKVKPARTHCGRGHEQTPENTYQRGDRAMPQCMPCKAEDKRRARARGRAV